MFLSDKASALYNEINRLGIRDVYARPRLCRPISNVYELVWDSWKERWLTLCGKEQENTSDFERLSTWLGCFKAMPDNACKMVFLEELSALFGEKNIVDLNASALWKKYVDILERDKDAVGNILRENDVILPICSEKTNRVEDAPTKHLLDINCVASEIFKLEFGEWEERIISLLKKTKPPYEVAVNIENIEFVRGDYYHAELIYNKIKSGDNVSEKEVAQLCFWLLSDVLSKLGESSLLHLYVGNNFTSAKALISYLIMRGICPDVRIGVSAATPCLGGLLDELCVLDPKRISLELVVGYEDSPAVLSRRVSELLAVYPAERLKFGGVRTDSKLFFAAHRYARKVICSTVSEIADDDAASEILKSIFN